MVKIRKKSSPFFEKLVESRERYDFDTIVKKIESNFEFGRLEDLTEYLRMVIRRALSISTFNTEKDCIFNMTPLSSSMLNFDLTMVNPQSSIDETEELVTLCFTCAKIKSLSKEQQGQMKAGADRKNIRLTTKKSLIVSKVSGLCKKVKDKIKDLLGESFEVEC